MKVFANNYGDLRFHSYIPDELLYLKIPNSEPFYSVGSYGNIFYQEVKAEKYAYWQSFYRPADNLTLHTHSGMPWLGFRLLLKKHIRHFMDIGHEIYLQQGQFNFASTSNADSTFSLENGKEYLVFDMYTQLSFLKNLRLNLEIFSNFLELADAGSPALLVKRPAWSNVFLLDALHRFFKYPFSEALASEVVRLVVMAAAANQENIQLSESNIENLYIVRESIKAHIRQHIYIPELARMAGMNEQYFKTGFKQVFGITPFQYLEYERLKLAKDLLLRDPRKGLEAIAEAVGYSDPSSFIRLFIRMEGVSPNVWRKRMT
jgi:AraC-like DNA-binding protein